MGTFRAEKRLWLSDRNSILMTWNLSRIRSEALIGRRSNYIVLAIAYEWQTKDKRPQRSNVNGKNLEQKSQYLWNIRFSRRSVWVLLELVGRWTQHITKINQKTRKLDKFVFGIPWLPDLLCKHWFASSVWNFCRWVTDVPPRKTSPVAKSKEKRMFSQASLFISVTSAQGKRLQGGIYEWLRCKYVKHHSRVHHENWDREEH